MSSRRLFPRPLPPGFIAPCLPTASDRCKSGPEWVHEIKHDGYRLIARRSDDRVRLYTRRVFNWVDRYAAVARDWRAGGSEGQLGQVGGLTDRERAGCLGLDDKKAPTQSVTAAILHRRGEGIESHRCLGLEVVEDAAALEVIADTLGQV